MSEELNYYNLRLHLRKKGIPESMYSVGCFAEEAVCIVNENNEWVVFEGEHGYRFNVKTFGDETDACEYFVNRITTLY